MLTVVIDTNVLVSGLAYPNSLPGRIVSVWRNGGLNVTLSHYILDELVCVLPRLPRITLNTREIRDLTDSLMFMTDMVEPGIVRDDALRDPADQPVLATLIAAQADYLITGDKDLLELSENYPIVTPRNFWQMHGG